MLKLQSGPQSPIQFDAEPIGRLQTQLDPASSLKAFSRREPPPPSRNSDHSVTLLVLSAIGGFIFLAASYSVLYAGSRSTLGALQAVQHTQSVLQSLDTADRELSAIDAGQARDALHAVDPAPAARSASNPEPQPPLFASKEVRAHSRNLVITSAQMLKLVADNPEQNSPATTLVSAASLIDDALGRDLSLVAGLSLSCHQTIDLMRAHENALLTTRTLRVQAESKRVLTIGLEYCILSAVAMASLFSLLMILAVRGRRLSRDLGTKNHFLAGDIDSLKELARTQAILGRVRDELQLCVTLAEAYNSAALYLAQVVPSASGAICLINESRNIVVCEATWGAPTATWGILEMFEPDSCCALRSGRSRWFHRGQSEVQCRHFLGSPPAHTLCFPLAAHGEALGFISVGCADDDSLRAVEDHFETIRQINELTAMAIAALKLRGKLQNQSIRDPLTGLFNRSYLDVSLQREIDRAARQQGSLAVLMLDVDHFKALNDNLGHAAGDAALRAVSDAFNDCVRSMDILCRYGGEEFAIVFPDISTEVALERAEAIRTLTSLIRLPRTPKDHAPMTISIGLAMFPQHGRTSDHLLRAADEALYKAKRSGRNRVVLADLLPSPQLQAPLSNFNEELVLEIIEH